MNFRKTILDAPIKSRKLTVRDNKHYLATIEKPLPEPLQPTPYVPPKPQRPTPKPRIKSRAPVALSRNRLPKKVREKVQRLIDEISPYYSPEAIEKFKKDLKFLPEPEIRQKEKALKGHVANYEVPIINYKDPLIQLAKTRSVTKKMLVRSLREKRKGFK